MPPCSRAKREKDSARSRRARTPEANIQTRAGTLGPPQHEDNEEEPPRPADSNGGRGGAHRAARPTRRAQARRLSAEGAKVRFVRRARAGPKKGETRAKRVAGEYLPTGGLGGNAPLRSREARERQRQKRTSPNTQSKHPNPSGNAERHHRPYEENAEEPPRPADATQALQVPTEVVAARTAPPDRPGARKRVG